MPSPTDQATKHGTGPYEQVLVPINTIILGLVPEYLILHDPRVSH